jgi:hypothetical protein
MKRIVLWVVVGFLVGYFCQYALQTPRVLAQSSVMPRGPKNQQFVLIDEAHNSVGALSFDGSGMPVIFLKGWNARAIGGNVVRILCEIRPWTLVAIPPSAGNRFHPDTNPVRN